MHVNIWFPAAGRTGRASLELSSGRYITGYGQDTLADDIESEGGHPDKVIDLNSLNLDEEAIEKWRIDWINGGACMLLGPNCCKVVYDALRAGGATFSPNVMWSPVILYRYLIRITEGWISLAASFINSIPI
ncbi:uncharacterized protein LOC121376994 [Gigantopelta aegis]|uniref:uncharacterized protein LOC121376994 n=1 Tax=Gigantopelta aegis TaxID=1735272 RepID=UPI001B888005|nr:uncharacterized protein LOC121376994 [Gigantopelta aegis]XP_041360758.1 uncharacterized protein LOC121376994 [Gigantopelta aegis]XP_041360759.1 uncharacterized protein LOC121376994 [Gigantopelta aegis]